MEELEKLGNNVDIISSSSSEFLSGDREIAEPKENAVNPKSLRFYQLSVRGYGQAKSLSRVLSWFQFELALFFLKKIN